jgi:hypothetical protein
METSSGDVSTMLKTSRTSNVLLGLLAVLLLACLFHSCSRDSEPTVVPAPTATVTVTAVPEPHEPLPEAPPTSSPLPPQVPSAERLGELTRWAVQELEQATRSFQQGFNGKQR